MDTSPHKSDFVKVNGIRLHYLDWGGSGPALLFLAGRGCNAHIFDGFAPRFTDQFHVLALTRRGHGESDYPETGYDVDTLTADIRQFLDCLRLEQVILVGHSLADIEMTHFAAQYPEKVLKLIYLDAAYNRSSAENKALREKWPAKDVQYPEDNGIYETIDDLAAHYTSNYPSFAAVWGEAMVEDLRHQVQMNAEGKLVYKGTEAIEQAINEMVDSYVPEYAMLQAPVLNIYAIKDNTYFVTSFMTAEQQAQMMDFFDTVTQPWNRHCIEQFRRDVPRARIVEMPHSHHYVFLKDEEQVYSEMRAFLLEGETNRGLYGDSRH